MIISPIPTSSLRNIAIPEGDCFDDLLLLASDSPVMKVEGKGPGTEDDALNLDELLRDCEKDANELADQSLSQHQHNLSTSRSPPPPSPLPLAPLQPLSRRNTYDEDEGVIVIGYTLGQTTFSQNRWLPRNVYQ